MKYALKYISNLPELISAIHEYASHRGVPVEKISIHPRYNISFKRTEYIFSFQLENSLSLSLSYSYTYVFKFEPKSYVSNTIFRHEIFISSKTFMRKHKITSLIL